MTGAKLYFSNDTIQHAGHLYADGHYQHIAINRPRSYLGEFGVLAINREVSGVTAACAAIRRETFLEVGGFAEVLPVNFNDVDLSYKVRRLGRRIVVVARLRAVPLREPDPRARGGRLGEATVTNRWGRPGRDAMLPSARPGSDPSSAASAHARGFKS